jgi:hypothetical protein
LDRAVLTVSRGAAVIEFELPEPTYEELALADLAVFRGKGPGTSAPLNGRVLLGGPHGFNITAARVAADPEIAAFMDENADCVYHLLYLGVSFTAAVSPRLESAQVRLTLSAVPGSPAPFALSMKPLADGDAVSVTRTVSLGPKLSLLDTVDVELGRAEREESFQRTKLAVRGLGLASATPGWEFTRTDSRNLEGSCMLTMVVQAAKGAKVTVTGLVTARAGGNVARRFARELPRPLDFATAI